VKAALGVQEMISPTAYILISTILSQGKVTQTTTSFADKPSCESAAVRQDFVLKSLDMTMGRWNLTCHPYSLTGDKK
jgi:hypothetical protein